jgi:hypothetical protein
MRGAEFLPDVSGVIEERCEPAYRLEQTCSLVRDREEEAARAANDLQGRPAVLSRQSP